MTVEYPTEPITNVVPGAEISKIVTIRNDGKSTAWIRVKVGTEIKLAGGGEANTSLVVLNFDDTNWKEKDGYYYYNKPVDPTESTTALFDTVKFDPRMGNEYQNCTVNINIYAQAVQTANNNPEGGVTEVKGSARRDHERGITDDEKENSCAAAQPVADGVGSCAGNGRYGRRRHGGRYIH